MHRGGGNARITSHNQGFSLIETFNNLALWGEKKFVSELKRTYKFQRGVNNILDCHANARNDVKRHTEDNSPKYRMVGNVVGLKSSHFSLKSAAFTLAEVLVTLGIIGVVAAMTMPALIQNYRNQVVETRLKKFYSTMNQAIAMSIKDNGDVETWTYFNNDQKDEDGNTINRTDDNDKSFNDYLAPYLKIIDKKDVTDFSGQRRMLYFFEDGSAFAFAGHENRDITFFPKNAEKCIAKENIVGNCAFGFEFYPIANNWMWKYLYGKRMEAVMYKWDGNEPSLYNDSTYGCKNGSGAYCTAIIQRNGWKVPKDYPKRIAF